MFSFVETNSQQVLILRDGVFKECRSDEVAVGDMLIIREGETFPCDLVLLASSNEGVCFIQTSSLDGEKNLKKRSKPKDIEKYILNTCEPDRIIFVGECVSENPTAELYQYTGKITICEDNFALTANQLLIKGANLKNTDWVVGYAIFTGDDTKLMMNSQKVRFKQSKMESKMNRLVLYIVVVQVILSAILAIIGSFWYRSEDSQALYLTLTMNFGVNGVISFFSYFLLLNTLLPISLIVTLEIIKVLQSVLIMKDVQMYSTERDRTAKVSSTSIIEELGQVNYIFSDKTGTLTRNVMEFKLMYVGSELYGNPQDLDSDTGGLQRKVTHTDTKTGIEYAFQSEALNELLAGNGDNYDIDYEAFSTNKQARKAMTTQRDLVIEFLKVLALAHECVPETVTKTDGTKITFFQGPSPDEVTLVDFAKQQGLEFLETSDTLIKLQYNQHFGAGRDVQYPVFRRMEFNSDRKRMSVVLRDPDDGLIKMYTKGADSVIKERLDPVQKVPEMMEQVEEFLTKASVKGLRTLLMAMRVLDEGEYKAFQRQVAEAEKDVLQRDKLLAKIYDDFENGFVLLGATAVEDRLQDNVP